MNAVVEMKTGALAAQQSGGRMAVADIISHVATVQEVMRAVMKPDVHFGVIPGTDKPTLLKPGAEVLCMAFRIADSYEIEDLSTPDTVRYRVTCTGTHQTTGVMLGTGMGEASSAEEKYKWRKAYKDEFEATPANLRREKKGWDKKKRETYSVMQVRTEPADLANTVLKMACKRAKIAMVLNVTAASDMFSQDLEDLDAELVRHLAEDERQSQLQMIRDEWIAKATAAKNRDELGAIMKEGVKLFQSNRDKDGYSAFATAVQKRGAELKEAADA